MPKEKPKVTEKEKKDIEIADIDLEMVKTYKSEVENDYKIPTTNVNEENNIGITDRDYPSNEEKAEPQKRDSIVPFKDNPAAYL